MDEFNEMLECSDPETRAIFYVSYHPGIFLDIPPMGISIFSVLTRITLKLAPLLSYRSSQALQFLPLGLYSISQFYW